jgi:hypothetical protein
MRGHCIALGLFVLVTLGCNDAGPKRTRLAGEAKYDGQPIVYGDIVFTPDGASSGAQGFANIRDGKFDTAGTGGKGIAGGPTIIRVTGFSKEGGKLLCEYEYKADLPAAGSTSFMIEVPAKGAGGAPKGKANSEI